MQTINLTSPQNWIFSARSKLTNRMSSALLSLMILSFLPYTGRSQEFGCSTPDPTPEQFENLIDQLPLIGEFVAQRPSGFTGVIPVYFTIFRNGDGTFNNTSPNDATMVEDLLNGFTQNFDGTGLTFVQLGDINYIDNEVLHDHLVVWDNYCYLQDALNIYIHDYGGGVVGAYPDQTPNNIVNTPKNATSNIPLLTHEMGHSFNLLHTHGGTDAYRYDFNNPQDPVPANQIDYPYNLNGHPRELQIRTTIEGTGKTFDLPNWHMAGDLCGDTYPACYYLPWPGDFHPSPEFDQTNIANCLDANAGTPCISGCSTVYSNGIETYTGTYRDYNRDLITPDLDNFMSYYTGRTTFTTCQKDRIQYTYQTIRKPQYEGATINLQDKVEFHGTSNP